jgi:hypothetical protein
MPTFSRQHLMYLALAFGAFVLYRANQWKTEWRRWNPALEPGWKEAFSQTLSKFPNGPTETTVDVVPGKVTIVSNSGSALGV